MNKEDMRLHEEYEVRPFNNIGKSIAENSNGHILSIKLDSFVVGTSDYEYIVVTFRGGNISVRNVYADSLNLMINELAKLLNGGYYDEVDAYNALKNKAQIQEDTKEKED